MRIYEIIKKKRDGQALSKEEIDYFVKGYTKGEIPDYQMSALLMAIYLNKMDDHETFYLTNAMINSGDTVDLSQIEGVKVDKHSTGGVGDSISLILGPMVAACDVPFVKMSGRGLGHTGGTLDKLESIKDFNVNLSSEEFINISNKIGLSICSQTANITPADKKLYSLRDVTATVENLSLIASSIMSKKLAIGSDAIVLDVKVGNGAFMKNTEDAEKLAKEMVKIGDKFQRKTMAILTDMNQPLGCAIGNALEVKEAVAVLKGEGPEDLLEISLCLGSYLLLLAKKVNNLDEARKLLLEKINSGQAYEKFADFVRMQKGDLSVIEDLSLLPQAEYIIEVKSIEEGYINSIEAEEIGEAALMLGAGRENLESKIDMAAGIVLKKKIGDKISKNEVLALIHTNRLDHIESVKEKIIAAYGVILEEVQKPNLIISIIE